MCRNKVLFYIPKFLLISIFLYLVVCESYAQQIDVSIRKDAKLYFLQTNGSKITSIDIEIAETPDTREKGLMYRELLDFSSGMLFVFQDVKPRTFWMHNTPTSLDMIFVDKDYRIVNIAKQTTPMSDQLYTSNFPAKYVVEVKAGFAEKYCIKEGTKIHRGKLKE